MPPRIRKPKPASKPASAPNGTHTTVEAASAPATAATPPAAAGAPTAAAPAPAASLVFLDMPPASANIPATPSGFVAGDTADYRAVLPRDAELRALPTAVSDLTKFTNYDQVLGETVPQYALVLRAFTVANAWSSMRTDTAKWDAFCGAQEGIAWTTLRELMVPLQGSFELAASGPSKVGTLYPGLATVLGAKKVIARKGASTRKANTKSEAKGEAPTHGAVGKARKRAAEKEAYAAANGGAGQAAPGPTVTASPVAQAATVTPPVPPAAQPVVAPSPTSPSPVPAQATVPASANGGTNGVAHS